MKLVRLDAADDGNLVSSSVAESEPVYAVGTTYAKGDQVRGTGALRHTVFESLQATNIGRALDEPDSLWWLRVGATNRWAMFDGVIGDQTTANDSIAVERLIVGRADSLALFNVTAAAAHVVMTSPTDGVVFDQTFSLVSFGGIVDWYDWLFEPVERVDRLVIESLPPYAGCTVAVTLADAGHVVGCGELLVGFSKHIGDTQWSPQLGIVDTSKKVRDDFGRASIAERPFYDLASFVLNVDADYVDQLKVELQGLRATPVLLIGDPGYASTAVYALIKSFQTTISYPSFSTCALDVEGLV